MQENICFKPPPGMLDKTDNIVFKLKKNHSIGLIN